MSSSINTNIAAYYAQANIKLSSTAAQSSIARLSSGNKIVLASDDVAALATGTSLATQVSALKTALTNAAQGSSLLQVADGALTQIQNILQQQQSLALQAQAGGLTNTGRGFLNQQFQALTQEIDILAKGTTFNGLNLIDGSIATGGSSSSNPLQNVGIVANTVSPTASGFTDLTAVANQSKAGNTYVTGSATGSATGFTAATTITQPANSYDKSLYGAIGNASNGTFNVTAHSNANDALINSYDVTYTASDGTIYSGNIATTATSGTLTSGTVTLTATTNPATHATLAFTVGATGFTTAADNSLAIKNALITNVGTVAGTGITYTSGTFGAAPTITVASGGKADVAFRGDLSQGGFKVELAVDANTVTTSTAAAKGYLISYTQNGSTYKGFLAGDGTAGHIGIAAAAAVTLSTGDNVNHSTIGLAVNTQFGASLTASVDQSANILSALKANFQGATALQSTQVAKVSGENTQAGIGAVSITSNPTKSDTSFVGKLDEGTFTVSGNTTAGYNVSYTLNGSTYQGALSAYQVTNGGKLVLDNGSGSLSFTITGNSVSANANTATSTALKDALTAQFAGATASAIKNVATTLQSNGLGGTVPGSAITSASTAGTLLDGFDGSKVTLTSSLYEGGATNLPPISNFSATGTGTSTVFSVEIGGTIYSTQGTVTGGTSLVTATFDGASAGILNFYKNGDKATNPNEVLKLDLSAITASAKLTSADTIAEITTALNQAFGGGGSNGSGGLTFQLGATADSNVTVNIASAKTTALFNGAVLDISTTNGATQAATTVATAIDTVTALRANVGALESQFNFAAAAIDSSVQNQDAARGVLLDTDIAAESTSFATSQVKLQAGISVLAQANQQLQALLKLIG